MPTKSLPTIPKNQQKPIVFNALRDNGITVQDAGKIAGYSMSPSNGHVYGLEKKRQRGLLSSLVPSAKKAIRNTVKGIPTGQAEPVKTSDVIAASREVLDREDPKIQKVESRSLNLSMAITAEQESRYRKLLGLPGPQDVVANVPNSKKEPNP